MSNLKCHVYFCAYNESMHCRHMNPDLDESANCVSYERKNSDRMKNPYLFEYAEDKKFSLDDDEHDIVCKTCSCVNNSYLSCSLKNVRIDPENDKAKCMNYRDKF